jgi:hypothetical protein
MSDGSNVDVATNLELGHLDHVLKWPPADPTIEVFVEVRVGGRRPDREATVLAGQARAGLNTFPVGRKTRISESFHTTSAMFLTLSLPSHTFFHTSLLPQATAMPLGISQNSSWMERPTFSTSPVGRDAP